MAGMLVVSERNTVGSPHPGVAESYVCRTVFCFRRFVAQPRFSAAKPIVGNDFGYGAPISIMRNFHHSTG